MSAIQTQVPYNIKCPPHYLMSKILHVFSSSYCKLFFSFFFREKEVTHAPQGICGKNYRSSIRNLLITFPCTKPMCTAGVSTASAAAEGLRWCACGRCMPNLRSVRRPPPGGGGGPPLFGKGGGFFR